MRVPGVGGHGSDHLGPRVSALVDDQLEAAVADVAWRHVVGCASCRAAVDRERWTKRRLAETTAAPPPDGLLGSLVRLETPDAQGSGPEWATGPTSRSPGSAPGSSTGSWSVPVGSSGSSAASWAAVEALEQRGRTRRRAGFAVLAGGSAAALVVGVTAVTGPQLSIGGGAGAPGGAHAPAPAGSPVTPSGDRR